MTNEEIKADCEVQYAALRAAEQGLKELRAICPHEIVFQGNYSYRIGSIFPAIICASCGDLIRMVDDPNQASKTVQK